MRVAIRKPARAVLSCVLVAGILLAIGAASAPAAMAAKSVVSVLGGDQGGTAEAQFKHPSGIAVNDSTGDFYVVDSNNDRVQQFTAAGEFVRAWGVGVAASGPDAQNTDEVVSLDVAATGGSYKLTYGGIKFFGSVFGGHTTAPIAYDAPASTVQAAIEALPPFAEEGGTVKVTGGPGDATGSEPYEITFGGTESGVEELLTPKTEELSGTATVTVLVHASAPFEVCAAEKGDTCRAGLRSAIAGGMNEPVGIAVEQQNGNVLVTDEANYRVDVYSATGEVEGAFGWGVATGASELQYCTTSCEAGRPGEGAGEFGGRAGYVALDPAGGIVYVTDPSNQRVEEYTPTLTGSAVTGIAFVRATGLYEPSGIAVDGKGFVYVLDGGNRRVEKLDPTGESAGLFATAQLTGERGQQLNAIAVDPSSGNVLVAAVCTEVTCPEAPLPTEQNAAMETRLLEFSSGGELLASDLTLAGIAVEREASIKGLAFGTAGNIYLSSNCWINTNPERVLAVNTPVEPLLAVQAPSDVGSVQAVLHGTVNTQEIPANQLLTEYVFEISEDGGHTWSVLPGTAGTVAASTTPVTVQQTVTGLHPDMAYEVRLHAAKQFAGGEASSAATPLVTPAAAPGVSAAKAVNVQATAALLEAEIEPYGRQTTWRVEYGVSEAYGSILPAGEEGQAGSGAGDVGVSVPLEGLVPGSTYYYRVVAVNDLGEGEAKGTFTTATSMPPAAATGAYTDLAQNSVTIAGTVSTNGLPTSYGFEVGTSPAEYGPPTGLGFIGAGVAQQTVSLSLTGLQPGTTYHYRITASNVDGTTYGADMTFTTSTFPDVFAAPPAPLPFLAVPSTRFPSKVGESAKTSGKHGRKAGKHGKHSGKHHARRSCKAKAKRIRRAGKRHEALKRCAAQRHAKGAAERAGERRRRPARH